MDKEEKQIKHLEMIEAIIERMGNNGFQLKGWAVTLVAIVGGLATQGSEKKFFYLIFAPLVAFWLLDSYYLQVERKYKCLYRKVIAGTAELFNMDTHKITAKSENDRSLRFISCMLASVVGWFYLAVGGGIALLAFALGVLP